MHRMKRRTSAYLICMATLFCIGNQIGPAQSVAQPDIYQHFLGEWVGHGVHYDNGTRKEDKIRITITETKKKDAIRLEKIYGKKGDPDFSRYTQYLRLDPARSRFALYEDHPAINSWYSAKDLSEFAKSGFGVVIGSAEQSNANPGDLYSEFPFVRLTIALNNETFSYKWERGADAEHMKLLSAWSLTRAADSAGR